MVSVAIVDMTVGLKTSLWTKARLLVCDFYFYAYNFKKLVCNFKLLGRKWGGEYI